MMNLIGSLVIGVILLVGTVAVSRMRCWGWILLIVGDLLDIPFAVVTGQFGFVALAATGAVIAAESWWRWRKKREPVPPVTVDWSKEHPERCYFYPGRDCPGWATGGTCQRVGRSI